MNQALHLGDLVEIVEDPMSFMIGEDISGRTGMIVDINVENEIYVVLLAGGSKTIKVLDFMMKKIGLKSRKSNRGRRLHQQ